jgi:glycosyltransferase involved in cell wall biosynthesis
VTVKFISLVIPCYNEAATVHAFYDRICALSDSMDSIKFEYIFVNDGSTDETAAILNDLAEKNPRVKVLHLAQNRGHQIALTAGIDHATGDMIVTIDADLQDPPELVREMLQKVESGYHIVHAQRNRRTGETWFKLASSRVFYRLIGWISNTPIIKDCGDFRAFTRPVQETLTAFRTPHRFLRGTFSQLGFSQCVIPYDRDPRFAGETKYPLIKMINLSIDAILGFSSTPIRIIPWFSIFLWAVSLLYLIKSLIHHFILKNTVPGWTSIIALMFFFTGLILFCIAIIASYIGRIFVQGQNPPLYWMLDTRNVDLERIWERSGELREVKLSQRIMSNKIDF